MKVSINHFTKKTKSASTVVRLLVVCALIGPIFGIPVAAETESRGSRDASGYKEEIAQAMASMQDAKKDNQNGYQWTEIEAAFDRASAAWMNVYGDGGILAVRPWVVQGMDAMNAMGWIPPNTKVVISMLDARGDFAQSSEGNCRAQINVDETGYSPVIKALGGKGSSVAFVIAHELAHCRFDSLSPGQKFPTKAMFAALSVPKSIAVQLTAMLNNPNEDDGSESLLEAYDESLADSAAATALLQFEKSNKSAGFSTAIANARSLRMGILSMANRQRTRAEAHQGGFVFDDAIAHSKVTSSSEADWDAARLSALKSVLYSSFSLKSDPKWWETVSLNQRILAARWQKDHTTNAARWRADVFKKAWNVIKKRNSNADEDLYLTARSPALIAVSIPDAANGNAWSDPFEHWKEVGWIDPSHANN